MKVQSKRVQITDEIRRVVLSQLETAVYYGGQQAYLFEREFADYLGVKHAVSVNSGTSALLVALIALGVKRGDEVISQANTYVTSAEVTAFLGATPTFCDVEYDTASATVQTLQARLTSSTKGIIVTHMYGQPADMESISQFARDNGLWLVENCAHALGAEYRNKKVGALGDVGVFSLGSKNISVCATGGMVATNSDEIHEQCAAICRHGWPRIPIDESYFSTILFEDSPNSAMFPLKRDSVRPGLNLQLDEIPCVVGRVNLRSSEAWGESRRRVADLYTHLLEEARIPVRPLIVKPWAKHAFLHYVVRAENRDSLKDYLTDAGIEALVHYPIPAPDMQYYKRHFPTPPEVYPVSRRLASEILTLPIHPWITDEEIRYVASRAKGFYRDS